MPKWFLKLHWFRNSGANTQSWPSCDHRVQASLGCPGAFPGLPHRESHCKHSQPGEAGVGGKYCSTGQLGGRHHHQGHSAPLSLSLSLSVCVCVYVCVCACACVSAGGLQRGRNCGGGLGDRVVAAVGHQPSHGCHNPPSAAAARVATAALHG